MPIFSDGERVTIVDPTDPQVGQSGPVSVFSMAPNGQVLYKVIVDTDTDGLTERFFYEHELQKDKKDR
jgi:hypothetical protein